MNVGTLQIIPVQVRDETGVLTTLDGSTPSFTLIRVSNSDVYYTDEPATNTGMVIDCLVDATGPQGGHSWVAGEKYALYVKFAVGAEVPYLGPLDVYVQ